MRLNLGYPGRRARGRGAVQPVRTTTRSTTSQPILDAATVLELQAAVRAVRVDRSARRATSSTLADATRHHPSVQLGCSPRGTLALFRIAQARALLDGRDYAIPEDVKAMAVPALAHRLGSRRRPATRGVRRRTSCARSSGSVAVGSDGRRGARARAVLARAARRRRWSSRLTDERLTAARPLRCCGPTLALALLGLDTRRSQASRPVRPLRSALAGRVRCSTLRPRPAVALECRLPERATAGRARRPCAG